MRASFVEENSTAPSGLARSALASSSLPIDVGVPARGSRSLGQWGEQRRHRRVRDQADVGRQPERIEGAPPDLDHAGELRPAGEDRRGRGAVGGDPEAAHLARAHRLLQELEQALCLQVRRPALVQQEDVDRLDAQLAQAGLEAGARLARGERPDLPHRLGAPAQQRPHRRKGSRRYARGRLRALQPARAPRRKDPELGRHGHRVAAAGEELAERALRLAVAVGAGGVEVRDAAVVRHLEQPDGLAPPQPGHQPGRAEAEAREREVGAGQVDEPHPDILPAATMAGLREARGHDR